MSEEIMNILASDAFSLVNTTDAINNTDHVPGRAGAVAFVGTAEGLTTDQVAIESINEVIELIQSTRRDAPAPQDTTAKANLRALVVPHIKLEETIPVARLIGVRQFGTVNTLKGVQSAVNAQLAKKARRHDLTLENLRLGALKGQILDADGTLLLDLFTAFSQAVPAPLLMDGVLAKTNSTDTTVRGVIQGAYRTITRSIKLPMPSGMRIHAFCGDNFFDRLVDCGDIKGIYDGYVEAERRMGENYAFGTYYYAGTFWENYQGTDDNTTVAIETDDAQLFPVGVPGLYSEFYAPADFAESIGTIGLPYYARIAPDNRFNREFYLHTQMNPLPICRRPQVLLRATIASE